MAGRFTTARSRRAAARWRPGPRVTTTARCSTARKSESPFPKPARCDFALFSLKTAVSLPDGRYSCPYCQLKVLKVPSWRWQTSGACATVLVCLSVIPTSGQQTLIWDANGAAAGTGVTGTWNTTLVLWDNAGVLQAWNNAAINNAVFGGTAGT